MLIIQNKNIAINIYICSNRAMIHKEIDKIYQFQFKNKNINKAIEDLNGIIIKIYLTDKYSILNADNKKYTLLQFRRIEILLIVFFDFYAIE